MHRSRLVVPAAALAAALVGWPSPPAAAQGFDREAQERCLRELARKPGVWEPVSREANLNDGGAPADIRAFAARLTELVEPFRRLPFLQPPMGVDVTVQLHATGPGRDATGYWPVSGFMSLGLMGQFCLNGKPAVRPDGRKRRNDVGGVTINVNDLTVGLTPSFTDSGGTVYRPVSQEESEWRGYRAHGRWVALTRRDAPRWIPASRERYLRHKIAEAQREGARTKRATEDASPLDNFLRDRPARRKAFEEGLRDIAKTMPEKVAELRANFERSEQETEKALRRVEEQKPQRDAVRARGAQAADDRVRALERELEAMTPEERRAPAYVGMPTTEHPSGLTTGGDRYGSPLVVPNPDFFDRSLPRSAFQLLVFRVPPPPDGRPPNPNAIDVNGILGHVGRRLWEEFDPRMLEALLR